MDSNETPTPPPEPLEMEATAVDGRKVVEEAIDRARTAPLEWNGNWTPDEERE